MKAKGIDRWNSVLVDEAVGSGLDHGQSLKDPYSEVAGKVFPKQCLLGPP